ncbi:MAG: hypothetical protein P0120_23710 [Nitrospira sp.]|nr:hypothetical protein [Nitrospira sp.]
MLSEKTHNQTMQKSSMLFTPVSRAVLQRKCACGTHTLGGGQCAECQKTQVNGRPLQTKLAISEPRDAYEQEADRVAEQVMRMPASAANTRRSGRAAQPLVQRRGTGGSTGLAAAPPIVHEVLNSPGQPLDSATRSFFEPRFGHDFSQVRVQVAPVRKVQPAYSGKSDCSPTWFGDTSPEVDPSGGSFTGRLIVKYNQAELKDPCVRECVEQHESVHVKHLTPIVKKIHDCDVAAGSDWDKKGKCNEMATRELTGVRLRSECEAYQKSFTCLTLKILDSKSPCSKPPHREQIQKHRGFEGCEMKRYCAEAGTPEVGIPNV